MAIVEEEEKREHPALGGSISSSHPLQHLQQEQSPAPASGIPGAGIQHTSPGDPARIPALHPYIRTTQLSHLPGGPGDGSNI